jgi:hypothetical protein
LKTSKKSGLPDDPKTKEIGGVVVEKNAIQ